MALRFYRDSFGGPNYETKDDSHLALGSLLTSDVQGVTAFAFDLLEAVELVRLGLSKLEEWEGNGWSGEFRPDGVHLQDLHSDDWRADYSLDLVREVTIDYIHFLRPDAAQRAQALATWEAEQGRLHPARDGV